MDGSSYRSDPWWLRAAEAPVAEVVVALGLTLARKSCACPACGAERRSSRSREDRRGAVGFRPDGRGWRCFRCGAGGSALDLAALVLLRRPWERGDSEAAAVVRAWFAARGWAPADLGHGARPVAPVRPVARPVVAPEPEAAPPPPAEVEALWAACGRLDVTAADPGPLVLELAGWLACERELYPPAVADLDLARVLPAPEAHPFPAWLPRRWWPRWRLVLPAWTAAGELGSVRVRAPGGAQPKERAPLRGELEGADAGRPCGPAMRMSLATAPDFLEAVIAEGRELTTRATLGVRLPHPGGATPVPRGCACRRPGGAPAAPEQGQGRNRASRTGLLPKGENARETRAVRVCSLERP